MKYYMSKINIDLSNILSDYELSPKDIDRLKSLHLRNKLLENNKDSYTQLIIPMSIYNLIESGPYFDGSNAMPDFINGSYLVGMFHNFSCHVDLNLHPGTIIMRHDRQMSREKKIDTILSDVDFINEIIFEVKY